VTDRIGKKYMSKKSEKAAELFKSGYNCSQAVVGAFAEDFGIDLDTAMRISEGMGGGIGRMRLTCGAVSAMAMLAGLKLSSGKPKDTETKAEIYALVQKMAAEFKEKNGTIVCAELLGIAKPKNEGARPEERTEQYYKKRPCIGCVADCAEIAEKYLLDKEDRI
jgi:C_GCAxxG_C_C family probable redox protein